ncbi:MAG: hypothetical protein CMP23_08015 [Rickettsiales bacterium]|nr:hypothetical protein [Rickettsiales bacterium]
MVRAETNTGISQSKRQLKFAREELEQKQYEKALRSAESALRLDPSQVEAILLKALAHRGLRHFKQARLLADAYVEELGLDQLSEDDKKLLERIQGAALSRPRGKRSTAQPAEVYTQVVDPQPYRERVESALAEGRCAASISAAFELTTVAPDYADGWRLSGDAQRCANQLRLALLDYRHYLKLGGEEPTVLRLVERLSPRYGRLIVGVKAPGESKGDLTVRLNWGEEGSRYEPLPDGRWLFQDLPTDTAMELVVSGLGLKTTVLNIEPYAAGETREELIEPEWLGLVTINLVDFPAELASTLLITEDRELQVGPGAKIRVTAVGLSAIVQNEFGTSTTHLHVVPDQQVTFDPRLYLPSRLTVSGLPAGSAVNMTVQTDDGRTVPGYADLPAAQGRIDRDTGVRIAPPYSFNSIAGGTGTLQVDHPLLGERQVELVLEGGALNASVFDWQPLPGVEKVKQAYDSWQQAEARARRGVLRTAVLAGVSGAMAVLGTGLFVGAVAEQLVVDEALQRALEKSDPASLDSAAITQAMADHAAARQRRDGLGAASALSFAVTGLGVSLTVTSGRFAKQRLQSVGPWQPELVE